MKRPPITVKKPFSDPGVLVNLLRMTLKSIGHIPAASNNFNVRHPLNKVIKARKDSEKKSSFLIWDEYLSTLEHRT
jgi:hypothetical protein